MRTFCLPSMWLSLMLVLAGVSSAASNSGITYQGRIVKPDGSPLSGQLTQFKMQLRTPDSANCLMYEEMQTLDLRNSNGAFSLTMNDGTGARTDSSGFGLDRIFANRGSFTFDPSTCSVGSTYAPNPGDGRSLVVLFKDETMGSWEPVPPQKINFVPFAFEAKQVAGFTADSLLRVVNASNDPITGLSPLSNAQYTELIALVNGTSTQFTRAGQLGGVSIPATSSLTAGQVLSWTGSTWAASDPSVSVQTFAKTALPTCGAGQFLKDNGTNNFICATPASSGGTVTQVNTGTGLTGGGFTTSGTLSIANQGVDTVQLKDGGVTLAKLAADSVDSSKIVDGSIGGADLSSSINMTTSGSVVAGGVSANTLKVYSPNNSNNITFALPNGGTPYVMTYPSAQGATGQVLTLDSSGNFQWATPAGTGLSALTGDVTASGSGSVAATVASVGGVTAANIATGANAANAATSANTASTLVKRDAGGSFSANAVVYKTGANGVTVTAPSGASAYTMTLPSTVATVAGQVLTSDTSGGLTWTTPSTSPTGPASGDLSGTFPGPAVASVGTSTAANIHAADVAVQAATALNTASTLVKRDASGNFAAGVATTNGLSLNNGGSFLNITNPIGGAWSMVLPQTAGSSGQVMATNGSGTMSWTSPLTSASAFVTGGNSFTANASLGTNDNYPLSLKTNNSTRMTIDPSGSVGIGTTSPAVSFEVDSPTAGSVQTAQFMAPNMPNASGTWMTVGKSATNYNAATLNFHNVSTGSSSNYIDFTIWGQPSQLIVRGDGNVGVGTTAPAEKLEVTGSVKSSGQVYSGANVIASGATVDFSTGNIQLLQAPGTSTITVSNLKNGGSYIVIVTDTSARQYTFSGCTSSQFSPTNSPTIGGSSIYNILSVTVSGVQTCFISWSTGYQ